MPTDRRASPFGHWSLGLCWPLGSGHSASKLPAPTSERYIPPMPVSDLLAGVMSGTSADGVDAAIVRVDFDAEPAATLLAHRHVTYPDELRAEIFRLRASGATVTLAALARLARGIALAYADATRAACGAAGVTTTELAAVAAHGQTLYHNPPDTIQWIDP